MKQYIEPILFVAFGWLVIALNIYIYADLIDSLLLQLPILLAGGLLAAQGANAIRKIRK